MYRVVVQDGRPDEVFAAIRSEWQGLFASAGCSPFLSWEWMSTWFIHFGENKTPVLLKAYESDDLIGILPLYLESTSFLRMRFQQLSLFGTGQGGADYLGPIAKDEDADQATSEFLEFIQRELKADLTRLDSLDSRSHLVRHTQAAASVRNGLVRHSIDVESMCPKVDLSNGWEAVLTNCKRKSNFKRRLKKLEQYDGFEFRTVTHPTELAPAFERFLALHNSRWENRGGSELGGHPRLIAFQRELVEALSGSGLIRFDELWVEGECRSSVYALEHGGTFYYYNSGYDADYAHLSVGLVLIGMSVRHAIERGNNVYDFLRGDEAYKFDWSNDISNLVSVQLKGRKFAVHAQEWIGESKKTLKEISKTALPTRVYETVGNWRRSLRRGYQMSGK